MTKKTRSKSEKLGKRRIKSEEAGIKSQEKDRISLLPDCLLVEIISRLDSTKEAIRTGTLSKRWQHLWTHVHNLIFINKDDHGNRIVAFFPHIEKTLSQCGQLNLNKLQVQMYYDRRFKSQINTCIRYAITRNVKEFDLSFYFYMGRSTRFQFDQFFYTSSCFNHLKLQFCLLKTSVAISWSKLKSLSISEVELDEESIQNILSGSPLLETLEFNECFGFRRIDITSKSVKNLVFGGYVHNLGRDIIEINAPYIESLEIRYVLSLWKFLLHDVSSLVKAKLDYWKHGEFETTHTKAEEEMLKGFVLSLLHVKELKIGKHCLKVLSRLEAKGLVYPSGMKLSDDPSSSE